MKKWIITIFLFALVMAETSCVVRVKERSRPYPPSSPHRVAVN